jgi:glycosyltransferase involved in cell wall biosynthesis
MQCLAAGLPVVANAVGVHKRMVRPGETGFLANSTQEWVDSIGQLMDDVALRRRLGAKGRQLAQRHYSYDRLLKHWKSVLYQVELARDQAA